jgi:hypothetical protein
MRASSDSGHLARPHPAGRNGNNRDAERQRQDPWPQKMSVSRLLLRSLTLCTTSGAFCARPRLRTSGHLAAAAKAPHAPGQTVPHRQLYRRDLDIESNATGCELIIAPAKEERRGSSKYPFIKRSTERHCLVARCFSNFGGEPRCSNFCTVSLCICQCAKYAPLDLRRMGMMLSRLGTTQNQSHCMSGHSPSGVACRARILTSLLLGRIHRHWTVATIACEMNTAAIR